MTADADKAGALYTFSSSVWETFESLDRVQGSGRGLSQGSLEKFESSCVQDKAFWVVSSGA